MHFQKELSSVPQKTKPIFLFNFQIFLHFRSRKLAEDEDTDYCLLHLINEESNLVAAFFKYLK